VETDRSISAATDDGIRPADELNRGNLLAVARDRPDLFAGIEAPDLHGIVGSDAGDDHAVPPETGIENVARMAFKGLHDISGRRIEDFHELVRGTADQHRSVQGKFEPENNVAMRILELFHHFLFGHVPDHQFAAAGGISPACGEELSIGTEGERRDPVGENR
jgi:hypothetical protein